MDIRKVDCCVSTLLSATWI